MSSRYRRRPAVAILNVRWLGAREWLYAEDLRRWSQVIMVRCYTCRTWPWPDLWLQSDQLWSTGCTIPRVLMTKMLIILFSKMSVLRLAMNLAIKVICTAFWHIKSYNWILDFFHRNKLIFIKLCTWWFSYIYITYFFTFKTNICVFELPQVTKNYTKLTKLPLTKDELMLLFIYFTQPKNMKSIMTV